MFPDTYDLVPGVSPGNFVDMQLRRFEQVLGPLLAKEGGLPQALRPVDGEPVRWQARVDFFLYLLFFFPGMLALFWYGAEIASDAVQQSAVEDTVDEWLDRFPTLDRCDQIGHQSLVTGFVLLTVGIAAGVMVNETMHDRFWVPGPKQTPPLLAWIVLATILVARARLGFRGRKSAYLTIAGVVLGLLTAVGMAV